MKKWGLGNELVAVAGICVDQQVNFVGRDRVWKSETRIGCNGVYFSLRYEFLRTLKGFRYI